MRKQFIITLASMGFSLSSSASHLTVPHGPDIEPAAAACGLGPQHGQFGGDLGQTTKAGQYNSYCNDLTDAEICLAHIKASISQDGTQSPGFAATPQKIEFCLEEFRKNLLGN